jgi:NAD(P)-dependent dehydrogenase (short-subunit alcohol dehydrogenase family)
MKIPILTMTGKVALITGGRRGIGKALALGFAQAGADVAICSRTIEGGELEAVADEIKKLGRRALAIRADVSRRPDVENMVKRTVTELGAIDILINNAGTTVRGWLLETDEDVWDEIIDTNLKGCYLCSQAVGRIMVEQQRGNIINIASIAGLKPMPFRTANSISKAGVIMLTRVLARELGKYNVRVNAIAPGTVRTPLNESWISDPEFVDSRLPYIPLGRFGEVNDIAGAALFLASDAASWITGHTIVVDGGFLA